MQKTLSFMYTKFRKCIAYCRLKNASKFDKINITKMGQLPLNITLPSQTLVFRMADLQELQAYSLQLWS
jgi:hypothetical protein